VKSGSSFERDTLKTVLGEIQTDILPRL